MWALTVCSFFLVVLAAVHAQSSSCYPCDPAWPRPYYYPNYDDCSTIWECKEGNMSLTACDPPQVFEFLLQACVPDSDEMLFTCNKLLHKKCTVSGR